MIKRFDALPDRKGVLARPSKAAARTLFDKIWDLHEIGIDDGESIIYIDLHLLHEVTSPQAFANLAEAGRAVRRPERTFAMADHNVPTVGQKLGLAAVADPMSKAQLEALKSNAERHGISHYGMGDERNGIVHVVGPERGLSRPGMTIVCGDSHTATHGALGAFAIGIGTSDIEHVLATQTIRLRRPRTMRVLFTGTLERHVTAKDLALHFIAQIGVDGGNGHIIEYAGPVVRALSMEGRLTLCNMSIEAGARSGLISPDDVTFAYLAGRPASPQGMAWDQEVARWRGFLSDDGAVFDREVSIDVSGIAPMVTWGTAPSQAIAITDAIPDPDSLADDGERAQAKRALGYMGLVAGQPIAGTHIDRVFIGSCTNSRIEDLRAAAMAVRGKRIAGHVRAMVVPGSGPVARQAEDEGVAQTLIDSGFEWREPGCSMCTAMNGDMLASGERCAATSNRNFENRQGTGGRTHLMSPAMAAAAAIAGKLIDVRDPL